MQDFMSHRFEVWPRAKVDRDRGCYPRHSGVAEVDLGSNPGIGAPIESSEPVDGKIEELFSEFDVGGIGRLGQDQFKVFLIAIGLWGSGTYTDCKWDSHWPEECKLLASTVEKGVDHGAFKLLYRSSNLSADHAELRPKFPHLEALCESKLKVLRLANCGLGLTCSSTSSSKP